MQDAISSHPHTSTTPPSVSLNQYTLLFIDGFLEFSPLQWLLGLIIGVFFTALFTAFFREPIAHWLKQRSKRRESTEQWYRDVKSVATRVNNRFMDAYWEPPDEPALEDVYTELEPLVEELEELIGDSPAHDRADATVHFAENLRQWCVRLKTDPEHVENRQYGFRDHMKAPDIISYHAERLEQKAENELRKLS